MSVGFNITADDKGVLTLIRPGQDDVANVTLRRAFPWSNPTQHISIRSGEGKELVLIEDLAALEPQLQGFVRRWLDDHRFIPKITRIESINLDFGYQQWKVQTDRGPVEFRVQEREDIRFLHDGRFSIKDADGNIYELARLDQLDRESRRVAESLI